MSLTVVINALLLGDCEIVPLYSIISRSFHKYFWKKFVPLPLLLSKSDKFLSQSILCLAGSKSNKLSFLHHFQNIISVGLVFSFIL